LAQPARSLRASKSYRTMSSALTSPQSSSSHLQYIHSAHVNVSAPGIGAMQTPLRSLRVTAVLLMAIDGMCSGYQCILYLPPQAFCSAACMVRLLLLRQSLLTLPCCSLPLPPPLHSAPLPSSCLDCALVFAASSQQLLLTVLITPTGASPSTRLRPAAAGLERYCRRVTATLSSTLTMPQ
jgi:hypothetical protein